jgi:cell wall-associated NlpC family hydrolase
MPTAKEYVDLLLAQEGDSYEWGAKPDPDDPDPEEGDCSGYVAWAANRLGVRPRFPHGSVVQFDHCRNHETIIPVQEAIDTLGALLFRISRKRGNHVATSLGDGRTIEAKGEKFGVVIDTVENRGWTAGALVPGLDYD